MLRTVRGNNFAAGDRVRGVMTNLIIFVIASMGIVAFSWQSLRNSRSHGFYRFFAFECLLILFLLNREAWFRDPFSWTQVLSWVLLCASLGVAVHGFYLLMALGKPEGNFENTTMLVIRGAYRYIRHPLYASLILLTWGVFFKEISLQCTLLAGVASAFLYATAKIEEAENLHAFGEEYASYMTKTKMFIPYLF